MRSEFRRIITARNRIAIGEVLLDKDRKITGIARVELSARTPELLDLLLKRIDKAWDQDPLDIRGYDIPRNGLSCTEPRF